MGAVSMPELVAHADWGLRPGKRQVAIARGTSAAGSFQNPHCAGA